MAGATVFSRSSTLEPVGRYPDHTSGRIALAKGLGTDVSLEALAVAQANAVRNAVAGRARFEIARSLEGVSGPFDVLVSNRLTFRRPPCRAGARGARIRSAKALDGGPDGLAIYREIASRAGAVVPAGLIAFEVGSGQAADVADILSRSVENRAGAPLTRKDLGGPRPTVALLTQS